MRPTFDSPEYLLLLGLLPVVWLVGRKSLAALGPVRRWLALAVRAAVLIALVCALAEMQWVRTSDRLTVLYILDQSASIPEPQRQAMVDYVNAAIERHRTQGHDRSGVIVYGRDAAIEYPAVEEQVRLRSAVESRVDPEFTNLAAALKLARAALPEDSAGRVVVVSDGNENLGHAIEEARALSASGVGIDVLPVYAQSKADVTVEKIANPAQVRKGQPFDLKVVLNHDAGDADATPLSGRLRIVRKRGDGESIVADDAVELKPGKQVFTIREQIDEPDFYAYEARFVPDDPTADVTTRNNLATGFAQVQGEALVLVIAEPKQQAEQRLLVDALRRENIQTVVQTTDQLFTNLAQLQPYDCVVLANVPREHFSDDQIAMLVRNTQQMGAGLVMLGGANSFGAGGWSNTLLEEAMPVEFQIRNLKVAPLGALCLVIDRSGSMAGEKLECAKAAAIAAVKMLKPQDKVGVVMFDDGFDWAVPVTDAANLGRIVGRIQAINSAGGTDMYPAMKAGLKALETVEMPIRHMVVMTDGHTAPQDFAGLVQAAFQRDITVSTVAVGADADANLLSGIATNGGGKFYKAISPQALPRIFQAEARRIMRPLVFEKPEGLQPNIAADHEIIRGLSGFPPLTGFVLTTRKASPLVEAPLISPLPTDEANGTLLASWTYGLGKAVAFTSDAGARWTTGWAGWDGFEPFFTQMIRFAMRPRGDQGRFTVSLEVRDGKLQLVVTALDQNDELLDFLDMTASAVGPNMQPLEIPVRQTAPGRYIGEAPVVDPGAYLVMIHPGAGLAPVLAGANVPYSAEFLNRDTNTPLLESLAALVPRGGQPGAMIENTGPQSGLDGLLAIDTFRHSLAQATSRSDAWAMLLFAGAFMFFADVFIRRVHVNVAWVPPLAARIRDRLTHRESVAPVVALERLRSRKRAIEESLAARRAAARFEPAPSAEPLDVSATLSGAEAATLPPPPKPTESAPPAAPQPEDYTSRLLKAKKRAWEDR